MSTSVACFGPSDPSPFRALCVLVLAASVACSDPVANIDEDGGADSGMRLETGVPDGARLDAEAPTLDASHEPDAGSEPDAGIDSGAGFDGGRDSGVVTSDSGPPDSGPPPAGGSCDPYREGTMQVSSLDCAGSTTPICDAVTRVCSVRRVETPCGACRNDADCEGTYPGSICVRINEGGSQPDPFMRRGVDYACAMPCEATSWCNAMRLATGWSSWECVSAGRIGATTPTQVCLAPTSATTSAGGCRRDGARRVRDLAGGG